MISLLAQAAALFASGQLVDAIEAMVARWRETRVPALADLIDRATRLLPTFDRPLLTTTRAGPMFTFAHTAEAEWMAAFETDRARRMPQLLQNVGVIPKLARLQVARLAELPDDPRIALRLVELLDWNVGRDGRAQHWRSVFELLDRYRDVRTFAPIVRHYEDYWTSFHYWSGSAKHRMRKLLANPASGFAAWPLAYTREDQALADPLAVAIEAQLAATERREAELLAAIRAEPDDDELRAVYGDWLLEHDHVRGELVALDIKPALTEAEGNRREELGTRPFLFGALHDLLDTITRVRGIPTAGITRVNPNPLNWIAPTRSPLVEMLTAVTLREPSNRVAAALQTFIDAAPHLATIGNARLHELEWLMPDHARQWMWRAGRGDTPPYLERIR